MRPIRVLIVDDEPLARQRLRRLLEQQPDCHLAGECATGSEAVGQIFRQAPELVFLDVQMPDLDGFAVIRAIGSEAMPEVVFVTAFDRYALDAFEVCAVDYLLKPFSDERFERALGLARERLRRSSIDQLGGRLLALLEHQSGESLAAQAAPPVGRPARRLAVQTGKKVRLVEVEEIDWIEADGPYVKLHVGLTSHLTRGSLKSLEQRLDPQSFVRIHRSSMVNVSRIRELQPLFHGELLLILAGGKRLKVSRTYRERLRGVIPLPI